MFDLKVRLQAHKIRKAFGASDRKRDAGKITPNDICRYDNILYGSDLKFKKWQLLDVYRPKDSKGLLPVIVIVHGGGWVYGDKDVYQFYGMSLAQRGFAVVNYSYRLAPEAKFPSSMQDTEAVFQWIGENAQKYGFDTQNVFAVGDSAGGHLLSLYASAVTNPAYAENFPFIKEKPLSLKAVALNCGKYNLDAELDSDSPSVQLVKALMPYGGTSEELHLIDGTAHVTKDFPPAFIMTCKGDFLLTQAPLMTKALEKAGVKHEYRCYGSQEKPLWHVFHCNPALAEATICNDEESDFFKKFISKGTE